MAASAATIAVGGVVLVGNLSGLSSSAAFARPVGNVAPLKAVARPNVVLARAALSEEQTGNIPRREMLASLMAAGAALLAAGSAVAASGPGTPGAKRTNEKAGELLKAADDLTNNESPPRFGPGRVDNAKDAGRVAQKAGAGAIEELQGGTSKAVEQAKENVAGVKKQVDNLFQRKTSGDLSDANIGEQARDKVSSDLQSTRDKVESDISTTKAKLPSDAKDQAGGFVAQAQKQAQDAASDVSSNSKSIFDSLADKAQNLIPQ